jgi:hypothetical protein
MKRLLSQEDLIYFFKAPDLASIKAQFDTEHVIRIKPKARNPHRINNRRAVTMDVRHVRGEVNVQQEDVFNLPIDRIHIAETLRPSGPDVDDAPPDGTPQSDREEDDSNDINAVVSLIWEQLPYDMISMGPNKKNSNAESHILMGSSDSAMVTMDIFRSFDMSRIFRQVQARLCDEETWELIFSRYFPPKSFPAPQRGSMQGFPRMKFWQTWRRTSHRLSDPDCERVRDVLRTKWRGLKWIPHASSDRAWETKQVKGRSFVRFPSESNGPCPQIAINPQYIHERHHIKMADRDAPGRNERNPDEGNDSE